MFSCPRCRETTWKKIVMSSLELRNIVAIAPKLRRKGAKEEGDMTCKRHQERLKLFCKDDQTLLCVVCDKSKEHQNHVVLPLEEAAQDYQIPSLWAERWNVWFTHRRPLFLFLVFLHFFKEMIG